METNLDPRVFRDAAERIASGSNKYCCIALDYACGGYSKSGDYCRFFEDFFKPDNDLELSAKDCWWSSYVSHRGPRIIALLLCADILESEQKAQRKRKR